MKVNNSSIKFEIGNDHPIFLIGGLNVIENEEITYQTAKHFKKTCNKLNIEFLFKASYDKANRSSIDSYRGPGLKEGLKILHDIKKELSINIITDVHNEGEVEEAANICDALQLPAFLARQTSLIESLAKSHKLINIKKPQFISPHQVVNIVEKFFHYGNNNIMVCERGSNFGYDNLVVDFLGFEVIKKTCGNIPLIFDITHSLQFRNVNDKQSGGRREQILDLALAGTALSISGIFLETHPNPDKALCDGPSALPLDKLEDFLLRIIAIDKLVKSFTKLEIK